MAEESYTLLVCPECGRTGIVPACHGWPRAGHSRVERELVELVPKARLAEVERERDGLEWALSEMTGKRDKECALREQAERERDERGHALAQERVELALEAGRLAEERDLREQAELDADDLAAELRATIRATVSKGIRDEPLTDEEIAARSPALAHHHERRSAATE